MKEKLEKVQCISQSPHRTEQKRNKQKKIQVHCLTVCTNTSYRSIVSNFRNTTEQSCLRKLFVLLKKNLSQDKNDGLLNQLNQIELLCLGY